MNFEIAVIGVGLARQQAFEFASGRFGAQPLERRLGLGDDRVLTLALAQFDQLARLFDLALDAPVAADRLVEPSALAQQFLGCLRIVPEVRVFRLRVQFGEAAGRGFPVKDASSAAPATF
jgi:hypothetical protein